MRIPFWWVSLAAVFVPGLILLAFRALISDGGFVDPLRDLAVIWLVIILPVTLSIERWSLLRLRESVMIWLSVGLVAGVVYRVAVVLWAAWQGRAPYPGTELVDPTRPYYIGQSISNALLMTGVGLIIWALVFWRPEKSRYSFVRWAWNSGSGVRRVAIRIGAALVAAGITTILANVAATLLSAS